MKALRALAIAAILVSLGLASCGKNGLSLFDFASVASVYPSIHYDEAAYPDLEELSSLKVWLSLPPSYADWPLRWTTDPDASIRDIDAWKDYDPDKGILLLNRCSLRAFAGNLEGTLITAVALREFSLRESAAEAFFVKAGASGDGRLPETAMGSLSEAVTAANALWAASGGTGPNVLVRVMGGVYQERLVLLPGVDLEGSYGPAWEPPPLDPTRLSSVIEAPSYNGQSGASALDPATTPSWAVHLPYTTTGVSLSFFRLQGWGGGSYGSALFAECPVGTEGPSAELRFCHLDSGGASTVAGAWIRGGTQAAGLRLMNCLVQGSSDIASSQSLVMGIFAQDAVVELGGTTKIVAGPPAAYPMATENEVYGARIRRSSSSAPRPGLFLSGNAGVFAKGGYMTRLSVGVDMDGGDLETLDDTKIDGGGADVGSMSADLTGVALGLSLRDGSGSAPASARLRGGKLGAGWSADARSPAPSPLPDFDPVNAAFSAGILLQDSSSLDLEGSSVNGGESTWQSAGILSRGRPGSIRVSDSPFIGGGSSAAFSAGIALFMEACAPQTPPTIIIERSRVWGGDLSKGYGAGTSVGISLQSSMQDAPLRIRNCLIHGGKAYLDETVSPPVYMGKAAGILLLNQAEAKAGLTWILNNTVWSPVGSEALALVMGSFASPMVLNNILLGVQAAVIAFPSASARPAEFRSNYLHASAGPAYLDEGAVAVTDLNDVADPWPVTGLSGQAGGNAVVDASTHFVSYGSPVVGPEDFRAYDFCPSNPATPYTEDGSDLSAAWGFLDDLSGAARTVPWSRGALELR